MNGRSFTPALRGAQSSRDRADRTGRPTLWTTVRMLSGDGWTLADAVDRFVAAAPASAASLFSDPDGATFATEGVAWAGVAGTDDVAGLGLWRRMAAEAVVEGPVPPQGGGPALFGALAFDADTPMADPRWDRFGRGGLVLPRRVLTVRQGRAWLTEHRVAWPTGMSTAVAPEAPPPPSRSASGGDDAPAERERWFALVEAARAAIARGEVRKVVVARRRTIRSEVAVADVLRNLAQRQPDAYLFAIAGAGLVFCGATPELLARVHRGTVQGLCLAGTTARGAAGGEDDRLGEALRLSGKDQMEHHLVREGVERALSRTCEAIDLAPSPTLRPLADVQHLATAVRARLRTGFDLLDVVGDLHPTPAVAGLPAEAAVGWLRRHEGLDRGLYGGPVGYVDAAGEGVFAVALRCAMLEPEQGSATLYAGCGIVQASDAEREWQESALKMRAMEQALAEVGA